MNYKAIGKLLAWILIVEAISMFPALFISLHDHESDVALSIGLSMIIIGVAAFILIMISRNARSGFYAREGLVCTSLAWIVISLFGALPFFFSGQIPSYINALFETVSGFTTTGASIIHDVDSMSRGLLYWRSFTHWLGGMGVLVFILTLASIKGTNSGVTLFLLRAESPGPDVEKIVPRMKKNSMILYSIYCVLTVLNIIFLLAGGMSVFESVCTAFGTAGTGGFSVKSTSLASYSSYIQIVTGVFMMLFGINFALYYYILLKKIKTFFKNAELKFYIAVIAISTILVSINIHRMYAGTGTAIKDAFFQVSSIITTTGFANTDFDQWPAFSKAILLVLMFIGACAGSTGGGIKCSRIIILIKSFIRTIRNYFSPQRVSVIKLNNTTIPDNVVERTNTYLIIYVLIVIVSFIVISIDGFSVETNISAVLACFNNIGPGFDAVGPVANYDGYGIISKIILIFDMLAGRLELIPVLALFSPAVWRRR